MKPLALACFALAILPTTAGGKSEQEIVAFAPRQEMNEWISAVSRQIDGTLQYPYLFREPAPSGGVSITFRCSENGRPDAIQVVRKSGSTRLDRAAVSAIQRIKSLHPLPQGIGSDQLFQANIVFATDERTLARERAAMRMALRQATQKLAHDEPRPLVIAIAYRGG